MCCETFAFQFIVLWVYFEAGLSGFPVFDELNKLFRKYTHFEIILSQRANATIECFVNSVRLVHVFTKKFQNYNAELSKHLLEHACLPPVSRACKNNQFIEIRCQ